MPVAGEAAAGFGSQKACCLGKFEAEPIALTPNDSNFTTTQLIHKANPARALTRQAITRESKGIIFGIMLNPDACKGL